MKRINIIKTIELEGYEVLSYEHNTQRAVVKPVPGNENLPEVFECLVQLEFNGYGDLVITLAPLTDEKFVYDGFEPEYNQGRPKKAFRDKIQTLKAQGLTQEQIAFKTNLSLSSVRRNWK